MEVDANKLFKEHALMMQTLGVRLFARNRFSGGFVEILNWDERQGKLYIVGRDDQRCWVTGSIFEQVKVKPPSASGTESI